MAIQFDQVEGVVQKASEPAAAPAQPDATTPKPSHESHEDARRRMERMSRRLHAD
jgi:hypothetical protein